mgnify:CR=1 FL=1
MYEVFLINEKGEKFSKIFESEFLFKKFINKVKYSKKLKVISYWRK